MDVVQWLEYLYTMREELGLIPNTIHTRYFETYL